MAAPELIRDAATGLEYDLDTIRREALIAGPGHPAETAAGRAQSRVRDLTIEISNRPQHFTADEILEAIAVVRQDLADAASEIRQRPDAVADYVDRVGVWAAGLTGNPTTRPPRFR